MPRRTWTDDDLRAAVARARSLNGVFRELALAVGGTQWDKLRRHIERLGLDVSHWDRGRVRPGSAAEPDGPRGGRRRWTDDQLVDAVAANHSLAGVARDLGLRPGGNSHWALKRRIAELGLSTEHFRGRGWLRGTNRRTAARTPLEEILVRDSSYQSVHVKRRLLEEGRVERRCRLCGGTQWRGRPMPLELDHINGDRRDHRIENLRLLCPNCHAQTPTYRGRNIGRYP